MPDSSTRSWWRRLDSAWLILLATLATYLATRVPRLAHTDSGELAAAAATGGIAHPTGYPLFVLLGWVWMKLPWSSAIAGLNILVAFEVAIAMAVTALVIRELRASAKLASITAALLLGFSATVWAQGTALEVYALHLMLLACTIYGALKAPIWGALGLGLMLTNHLSSVFLAPAVLWVCWSRLSRKRSLVVALMSPLALYVAMVARSSQLPELNWGWVHRGVEAFVYHVSGAQFRPMLFQSGAIAGNARLLGTQLASMLLWVGLVPAAFGAIRTWKTNLRFLHLLAAGNLVFSLSYGIPDIEAYFLPTYFVVAVWFALGVDSMLERMPRALWATLLLPLISLGQNWSPMNRSRYRAVDAYVAWAMDNTAPNALVLTREWDFLVSPFWYLQAVEGVRRDVTMVDTELLRRTWYLPQLQHLYPQALAPVQKEAEAYLSMLQAFERDPQTFTQDNTRTAELQSRYVALLRGLIGGAPGPVYVTAEMLRENRALAEGFNHFPAGPLTVLTRNSAYHQVPSMQQVPALIEGISESRDAKDQSLREIAAHGIAGSAIFSLEVLKDRAAFLQMRMWAKTLAPAAPTTALLDRVP